MTCHPAGPVRWHRMDGDDGTASKVIVANVSAGVRFCKASEKPSWL